MMENTNRNKSHLVFVICLLVVASSLSFYLGRNFTASSSTHFIDVSISPSGVVKLGANQQQTFVARVLSVTSGTITFEWSVRDLSGNSSEYVLTQNGNEATFYFTVATQNVFELSVRVLVSKDGVFSGQGYSTVIVTDPYTIPNIYLDALPSTADYVIETDGLGWYRAISKTGQQVTSSTNCSDVFSTVKTALSTGGMIHFGVGEFSLTSTLLIAGDNSHRYFWTVIGSGRDATNFTTTGTINIFTIQNYAGVVMKDFSIYLPRSVGNSGHGIYGPDVGYSPLYGKSIIENVLIDGGDGTGWGIFINNPNTLTIRDLQILIYGAGGIHFHQASTTAAFGNTIFDGNVLIDIHVDNAIGFLTTRTSSAKTLNMILSNGYFEVGHSSGTAVNSTGIWADALRNSYFEGLEFEGLSTAIYGNNLWDTFFSGGDLYSYVTAGNTFIELTSSAYMNIFKNFCVESSDNLTMFSGGTNDPRYQNIFEGWILEPYDGGNFNNTVTRATVVRNMIKRTDMGTPDGTYIGFSGSPVGVISSPIYSTYLLDFGGTGNVANATTYTCCGSTKTIYITGGTVSSVKVDGTTVRTATGCEVVVPMYHTFSVTWSSSPTIVVVGE